MEPAAPGTEDEVPVTLPTFSKKANENERVLSLKAILPNGVYGNVFELSYVCGAEHWYCNMCECPVMGRVYHHEIGKRHTTNTHLSAKRTRHGVVAEQPPMLVAPGEPLPPGFEGAVQKVAQIQDRLDSYNVSPLIGLEYLLEIQEYDTDKEASYLCMLCDKRGDPRTVIAHLVSYNHICQYLQRHFIKCYQALSPYMTKQYKRNWQNTVNKIAEAIEQRYGRLKPHPVEKEGFEEKKATYWEQIFHGPHFSEKHGVTFENLIIRDEITKVVDDLQVNMIQKPSEDVLRRPYRKAGGIAHSNESKKRSPSPPTVPKPTKKNKSNSTSGKNRDNRRSLSSVSSISSSDLSDYELHDKKRNYRSHSPDQRYRSRSPYRRGRYQRSPSPRKYREKERGGVLPWQRPDYIKSKTEVTLERNKAKADKLDEFKRLAAAIENDMEKTLKGHERNPEKHPQYNEEWKVFWNKRYKELQNEGKDAANYDFKPEWIVFWNKRMTELHNAELKGRKDALRRRLGLPDEPAPICFRITGKKRPGKDDSKQSKLAPMASEPDQDHEVIVIDDKDDDTKSSKRSHSPWENESGRPGSRVSRDKSRDRDYFDRGHSQDRYDRRSPRDYKRDYRSPERRYDRRRERSRDREVVRGPYKREVSWEREPGMYRGYSDIPDCYKPPPVMRDVTRQPVFTPPKVVEPEPEEDVNNGEVNIVAVLRLLTALEEKLGSLGPKVIDMLAQALAMEKNEANSSELLLDNDVNCVLFETVKEKLKGQLLAGLVDYTQEKAFKNAIKKIASLMHFANERKREKMKVNATVDPVKVPGIGTVDKSAIAKQIATALVSQGKTDVTQEELEQLINAVVGMAEASKAAGKPMTTASFIESLSKHKQTNPPKHEPFSAELKSQVGNVSSTATDAASSMDGLSDSDLQTLLQNFKDLSTEEQHGLITYLKKLEAKEPERVERLRKFVNLGQGGEKGESKRATSPFSSRLGSINPMVEETGMDDQIDEEKAEEEDAKDKKESERGLEKIDIDSEEEDYTFDDVFQVAKMNVKEKELEKEKERKLAEEKMKKEMPKLDLSDAKALIANIMGTINKKESTSLLGLRDVDATDNSNSNSSQTQGSIQKPDISIETVSSQFQHNDPDVHKNLFSDKVPLTNPIGQNLGNTPSNMAPHNPNFRLELNVRPPYGQSRNNPPQNVPMPQQNMPQQNVPQQLPNVQYPLKNPYGNYNQYPTAYPNQAQFNRGPAPPYQNQYGNRFPFNSASGRGHPQNIRGNYQGGRW